MARILRKEASFNPFPTIIKRCLVIFSRPSRRNLIGDGGSAGSHAEDAVFAEKRVSPDTPPTFLFHMSNDTAVPMQNVLGFAAAMARHKESV
ncbi:hypothetical protein F4804DRAFT_336770 [Jackrogersella minutella]|nr:hypothetical protein F4804DRAFT_336770 [Jackrogersella minutella]